MKHIWIIFLLCWAQVLQAQDQIETDDGIITINPILHGSLVIQWHNANILIDPYGGGSLYQGFVPDLILITDIHGDHYNPETLNALDLQNATIIAPTAVRDMMDDPLRSRTEVLANGANTSWQDITIQAIPMYNLPESEDSRHPKGRGNGYVLDIGGKRLYISGDTEDIPEMRSLRHIDVAFVCMNLPYTMDINQAADAVIAFQPGIVYPFHYRGGGGTLSNVQQFKSLVDAAGKSIEVRLRNWYNN